MFGIAGSIAGISAVILVFHGEVTDGLLLSIVGTINNSTHAILKRL